MEQERANGNDIDDSAISGVKVGLMGPLAGVGDPIFWGTLRPVLAALGAGLAITGSLLGPLLFFIGINLCRAVTRWYGFKYGYEKGTTIVNDMGGRSLTKIDAGGIYPRSLCHGLSGIEMDEYQHSIRTFPL